MRVEVYQTYADLSGRAAAIVAALIRRRPEAVLALPTGSTPVGFYQMLGRSGVSFARVRTFNLDEYLGLSRTHPQSYYAYMHEHLYRHIDIPPEQTHIPDGAAPNPEAECERYEAAIAAAGGLDVVVLGLGYNGHIGFNEPGTPWDSRTRRVQLAERTRQANARFFGSAEQVPAEALTMGIGTILSARHILLLAAGESKAGIVYRTLQEAPTAEIPATALRAHPNVTMILDRAAAGRLTLPMLPTE